MRQFIVLIILFSSVSTLGQNTFKGEILSIVDSTPLTNYYFRVDNKKVERTDSLGYFSIITKKNRLRISSIFDIYGFDTTLRNSNRDNLKIYTIQNCDSILANYDIQKNNLRLFCGLGFTPLVLGLTDKEFENEYHTSYYIVGDFLPSSVEKMIAYNKIIAQYLDIKFGKKWRTKVRSDVLGVTFKVSS